MPLPILYNWCKDIVFHVLTHMKIENASNIFNETYVHEISQEKRKLGISNNLPSQLDNLTDYYIAHFERLSIINFIPFMINSFEELTKTLANWSSFTEEDKKNFINDFVALLEQESDFYEMYWYQKNALMLDRKLIVEKNLYSKIDLFNCLFDYYTHYKHKDICISLSYSMGQNGRCMGNATSQLVAVPFPFKQEDEDNTFFMTLHELTHPCTDSLIGSSISMKDGSHALTENIVMVADYELIKALSPTLVKDYFNWICNKSGNSSVQLDEQMFYSIFIIPQKIKEGLTLRLKEILDCSK